MDTIGLTITVKTGNDFDKLISKLLNLRYCDILNEVNKDLSLQVKLSYPKFFYESNAYLITGSQECLMVHQDFAKTLRGLHLESDVNIKLTRVDIPFSYLIESYEEFHSYENIFMYMAQIYSYKNGQSVPKVISELLTHKQETYLLADTSNPKNSTSKITIYNQGKRFKDCYGEMKINRAYSTYEDFGSRIRIEPSKRIKRNHFTISSFETFDIYGEYYPKFRKYLLSNLLDLSTLNKIQEEEIRVLTELLLIGRSKSNFTYECFIRTNLRLIKDYKVIGAALENNLGKGKSLEKAITKVRKILATIEVERSIIIIDTFKKMNKMAHSI